MASIRSENVLLGQGMFLKAICTVILRCGIHFLACLSTFLSLFISTFYFTLLFFTLFFFPPFVLLYDRVCWSSSPLYHWSYKELCRQSILKGFPNCWRVRMYAHYVSVLPFFLLPFSLWLFLLSFYTFITFHALFSIFICFSLYFLLFLHVYLVFLWLLHTCLCLVFHYICW